MKFKVAAKVLRDGIRTVEDIIKRSPSAQATLDIMMSAAGKSVVLEAFSGDVYAKHTIEADVSGEGTVVVDAQHIRNLKFSDTYAVFELKRSSLLVKCGRFSASLETSPAGDDLVDARPGKPDDITGDVTLRSDALVRAIHHIFLAPYYGAWLPMKITVGGSDGETFVDSITYDELRAATYSGTLELVKGDSIEILASSSYLVNMLTKFEGNVRVVTTPRVLILKNKTLEVRVPTLAAEEIFFPDVQELLADLNDKPRTMYVAVASDDMLHAIQQLKALVTSTKSSPNVVLGKKVDDMTVDIDTSIGKGKVRIENVHFREDPTGDPKIPLVFLNEVFALLSRDSLPKLSVWEGVVIVQYDDQDGQKFVYVLPTAQ